MLIILQLIHICSNQIQWDTTFIQSIQWSKLHICKKKYSWNMAKFRAYFGDKITGSKVNYFGSDISLSWQRGIQAKKIIFVTLLPPHAIMYEVFWPNLSVKFFKKVNQDFSKFFHGNQINPSACILYWSII